MTDQAIVPTIYQLIHEFKSNDRKANIKAITQYQSAGLWWKLAIDNLKERSAMDVLSSESLSSVLINFAFHAPNFASAFNSAYQIAIRILFPNIKHHDLVGLCISERGGNSPNAINCTIQNGVLNGYKTFMTNAKHIDTVFVMANDITQVNIEGQKNLKLLRIDNVQSLLDEEREGFNIILPKSSDASSTKKNKFLPEIEKGHLELTDFHIPEYATLLDEAHQAYSKPFSIIEGLCIRLACVSQLLKWALVFSWPQTLKSDLIVQITSLACAIDDPLSPISQLLIDSQNRLLQDNLQQIEKLILNTESAFQEHWQRDKVIFYMDLPLRENRLKRAVDELFN